jgi:hypothetical protein
MSRNSSKAVGDVLAKGSSCSPEPPPAGEKSDTREKAVNKWATLVDFLFRWLEDEDEDVCEEWEGCPLVEAVVEDGVAANVLKTLRSWSMGEAARRGEKVAGGLCGLPGLPLKRL